MSFPMYKKYVDSGIELIPSLPSHWKLNRFKQVLKERNERSDLGEERLLSVSSYTGVKPRDEVIEEGEHLSRAESLEGYKLCYKHDLVMNIMLAWNRGLAFTDYDGIVSPSYCVFSITDDSNTRYLNYLVRSDEYILYFEAYSSGVIKSRLRLYPDKFGQLLCIVPPLEEQTAIANFLDVETAKIDALVAEQQRLIELLKEKRQAVISHAVTKGLNPDAPLKDSGIEWLGEVPEHWEVMKLGRITLDRCDGPFGSGLKSQHYTDEGIRVVRLNNIRQNYFDDTDAAYIDPEHYFSGLGGGHDVVSGDLLIAGLGDANNTVGRACVAPEGIEPAMVKADCFRFRLDTTKSFPNFISAQLTIGSRTDAGLMSTGTTRSRMPLTVTSSRKIALPNLDEQHEIATFISESSDQFDSLVSEAEQAIELLQERRTALISAAVTGKIDVREYAAQETTP